MAQAPRTAELRAAWRDLAGPGATPLGEELIARYAEPHRRYHDTRHLAAVLDLVDTLAQHADDPRAVRFAAWYHDAVYDPTRLDNEEYSAVLAETELPALGARPAFVQEVVRLVRLTATHDPAPHDRNGAVLCDADLTILAAPPDEYAAYAAAIREEYAHLPENEFRAGRAAVLRRLLDRPVLFHTRYGQERFEDRARANLGTELTLLAAGGTCEP
ncbi:hypothetical protein LI90_3987 [Carbonactinospora thermoautotrophica]|uniref:Metal-dependent phosphohydrolase n=1 Tax=Carbonactinospora thermoautotrophica TaxID=1469144 RepID=A0A132MYG7_9ACTN|nr:hypothetical protein LI90_3987 [Carbonactinospora thermoautotrophica]